MMASRSFGPTSCDDLYASSIGSSAGRQIPVNSQKLGNKLLTTVVAQPAAFLNRQFFENRFSVLVETERVF
jgi:hypothetical protein